MSDGTTQYLPVSPDMTCEQRPSVAQAQAQVSLLLPASFVPSGYFLDSMGCLLPGGGSGDPDTTDPGSGDPGSGSGNSLVDTDVSGATSVSVKEPS